MHQPIRKRLSGPLIGALVTAIFAASYAAGRWADLDLWFLDLGFRHFNRIAADDRIVLIDIDDASLERVGRWPWPRRIQADLVNVLRECGARAILLDLVYAEPSPARIEHPALDPAHEFDPAGEVLGDITLRDAVHDDEELAEAIARAGCVYVPMYFAVALPGHDPDRTWQRARRFLDADPDASLEAFRRVVAPKTRRPAELLVRARIDRLLREDFNRDVPEIAEALGVPPGDVESRLATCKEEAARYLVRQILQQKPGASFPEIVSRVLPGQPADVDSAERRALLRAYRYALAMPCAFGREVRPQSPLGRSIPNGYRLTLPIPKLAKAARRLGFVSFRPDADGVVRHLPPVAEIDGRLAMQVAFAMAVDALDIDPDKIAVEPGPTLLMSDRSGRNTWRFPLDGDGEVLLNWHVNHDAPDWTHSFHHLPADRIVEVALNRRTINENRARLRLRMADAVALMYEGAESAYLDFERDVRFINETGDDAGRAPHDASEAVEAEKRVKQVEDAAIAHLRRLDQQVARLEPQDSTERALFERVKRLSGLLLNEQYRQRIELTNKTLQERNDELLTKLRQQIDGKLCLVGHTAAAQADMAATPVYEQMPGVMAHANFLNTLLQNRIPMVAPPFVGIAAIVAGGVLTTLVSGWRNAWGAFKAAGMIIIVAFAGAALVMWSSAYYLPMSVAAVTVFVTWAMITMYRQLTEERRRRSLARELSRNTSPAIAAHITEQLDELDLTPRPAEVTCYFSDLQGFTTLTEHLGLEATRALLNRYLAEMGELLVAHRAFNKFMGDGIFAFFNAPIWPADDHVVAGCDAALATLHRLAELKSQTTTAESDPLHDLRVRIGLHTGPAYVGYFGSDNQSDYTCIGDTVNLASRLESANKLFNTQIIASGACRDAAGNAYAFRSLGLLLVKGRSQAVPIHELLGRAGQVDAALVDYARQFEHAVQSFQHRDWAQARRLLGQCARLRPADGAARFYLDQADRLEASAPPDDWNGAVSLTAK